MKTSFEELKKKYLMSLIYYTYVSIYTFNQYSNTGVTIDYPAHKIFALEFAGPISY